MTRARFWLWCRTVAGAALVYATVPLLVIVWAAGKLVGYPRFSLRRHWLLVPLFPAALAFGWLHFARGPADTPTVIQVRPGMTFGVLIDSLAARGVVRHPVLFRAAARLAGIDRQLHIGLYEFAPAASPYDVLRRLARHEQVNVQFTVVEGATMSEFLPLVAGVLELPLDALTRAAGDPARIRRMGSPTDRLEGYLFPETYTVPWGADAGTVVDAMLAQFETVWDRVRSGYGGTLSRHQAVTLASLIEAEAKDGAERGRISSVFHNRLERRMRLQCDPTVIYAMGGLDRPLLRKDWQYQSPYNTYVVAGLPPGPICSPGEASLRAALYPETTEYLYFVARGDGTHVFSRTLTEHERAIAQIKSGDAAPVPR
jgi:UPF0755 protein